ncbi:alpha/beta fold hydrolase [Flavobacterium sp. HSC-61S13]|uniref:alpha/beta fold hydrolase n=1 Tax=Flavobacterium sp. HSC-61S13 TaxID=2910963 RepID=UPI0020A1B3A7|nr:alpha/beta hydrolase [Flavobacterium sp. HSC-61S13]MCP1996459.1 pimeloyl-ACP methyl ester carboxylesterase [Flavobacterium sp. HSC-61S13]
MKKVKDKNTELHVMDYGSGPAVILMHGWPLSSKSWEYQITHLVNNGYRVIAYDRKGFGQSAAPWDGYSFDELADDLNQLILDLKIDKCTLVGFSMGGGEVIRYLSKYGSKHVSQAVLVSSIIPLVKQHADNPAGVPQKDLDQILQKLKTDRLAFLKDFHQGFYNYTDKNPTVHPAQLDFDFSISSQTAAHATIKAAQSWIDTDFRAECKKIDIPVLIIHGDADQNVPIATAGDQAHQLIKNSIYKVYKKAPHGLNITHKDDLNKDLVEFLGS